MVLWYIGTMKRSKKSSSPKESLGKSQGEFLVERVQTGVRMERRIIKVLKALAEYLDLSLGDLLEGIVLHAFEGKALLNSNTLRVVGELKRVYGLDLSAEASHRLRERGEEHGSNTP